MRSKEYVYNWLLRNLKQANLWFIGWHESGIIQSVVVVFLYIGSINCHSDFALHCFVVMSKKLRVLFCTCSSVNSRFGEMLLSSSKFFLVFVFVKLCTIRISSVYLK